MKILFLTTPVGGEDLYGESYLEDSIFIGLRRLLGPDCVDYPKKKTLYNSCEIPDEELYGRGFTIWKNLPEISSSRENIFQRLRDGEFDLVIFGNIQWQPRLFNSMEKAGLLEKERVKYAFLDGVDYIPKQFAKKHLKRILIYYKINIEKEQLNGASPIARPIISEALEYGPYFKRELDESYANKYTNANILQTSFSIPSQKVRETTPEKTRLYGSQVQCDEAYRISKIQRECTKEYQFWEESNYYRDMAESYFSITQMKGGWDCMRHYEIAANQSVPCFYKMSEKPLLCAPHGLKDMYNCITFQTAEELQEKIDYAFENDLYTYLQKNLNNWIGNNTSSNRAKQLLRQLGFSVGTSE